MERNGCIMSSEGEPLVEMNGEAGSETWVSITWEAGERGKASGRGMRQAFHALFISHLSLASLDT